MKLTTAVISLVTISGAYAKGSKASTKSTKSSKSTKAICIEDSSLSFSLSSSLSVSSKYGKSSKSESASKSGKANSLSLSYSLSVSSKSRKSAKSGKAEADERCLPCAFGVASGSSCGTEIGYCEFESSADVPVPVCTGKSCTPQCSQLEPRCSPCVIGELFPSVTCPTGQGPLCEFVFSVDSTPTCVASSDCVPSGEAFSCGTCTDLSAYPQVDGGVCQLQSSNGDCVECPDTGCPNLSEEESQECFDAVASERRLEMGHEEWGFKKFGLELGL